MLRSDLPPGTKTILAIWYFKRKRYPDKRIQKYKVRIYARIEECRHGVKTTERLTHM